MGALVKALAAMVALALGSGGCAMSWGLVQASGRQEVLDEGVHESAVPIAGATEALRVRMPLVIEHEAPPAQANGSPGVGLGAAKPFALACQVTQHGQDTVYHAAFRYGHQWKWATALMFVVEAGLAAAIYFDHPDDPQSQVTAGLLGLDAAVTGVLAFAPRKEVFRTEVRAADTVVRGDCPEGLALAIGDATYAVDAAGRVGELGDAALAEWMRAPGAPVRVTLGGQAVALAIGLDEQCSWLAAHPDATAAGAQRACLRYRAQPEVTAQFAVPLGTLTHAE